MTDDTTAAALERLRRDNYTPDFGGREARQADLDRIELALAPASVDEATRRDAERYRFLRNGCSGGSNRVPHIYQYPAQSFDDPKFPHFKDVGLDAAIDAALAAQQKR